MTARPIRNIEGYHAHVYYSDEESRRRAATVRAAVEDTFEVRMGRWRDSPVGPHPQPMYQIAFAPAVFAQLLPWLMLNRAGLSILVHPETGDDLEDHAVNRLWLGEPLPLVLDFFGG